MYTRAMEKLTLESIADMSDEDIVALTEEHPELPEERVFVFTLRDFDGDRALMAACMAALTVRLREIQI